MKVAFAEGYLAGDSRKKSSKTVSALRVAQLVLTLIALIAIVFSLTGEVVACCFNLLS